MAPKRLVLFVEGKGDVSAAYFLVKGLLSELEYQDAVFLDQDPYRVHGLGHLAKDDGIEWIRFLRSAVKTRKNLGGVLLLADGDLDHFRQEPFCAMKAGRYLSQRARAAGAGATFSVASVIAMQEYETWLIAGMASLAGRPLPDDGRPGVKPGTKPPAGDLEKAPRDAKKWLGKQMFSGYKPTTDQAPLTKLLVADLAPARERGLRSFRRLEKAVHELVEAIRAGTHIATPEEPPR